MAAVTADTMTLPRVRAARLDEVERPVLAVSTAPEGYEGEGFPVRRTMAGISYQRLDPFIMMDHMGEVDYQAGEPKGTPWHPHRGFETVTYLIEGQFVHQDSHGGGGVITEGGTQWMTAGSGLLHIETPPEELVEAGGLFHGFQLWVNLPAKDKFTAPAYQGLQPDDVKLLAGADGDSLIRVIAGDVDGHVGPGSTHTPITVLHASINPDGRLSLPWQPSYNALVYVMAGSGTVGAEQRPIHAGQLAVLGAGQRITLAADRKQDSRTKAMEAIVLGGQPIGEPMVQYGPFVMNTREQLVETIEDYQQGRLGVVPPNAIMPHVPRGRA
ncbi:pirin family protein [Microlunatus panaciterrae]|uniref:Redox-sensitive bicupin YhaK (Pirin superfamily) n=1 Tax=Microlunatus panaciterrae TaxID=400768 RepID=A0ABS2RH52_9ACTN|nr:pirin family protein [Microlunatus panaciterrae]MBM7797877.1 redox-sensitive bicupin YhaK (pirin superfamily) [Microlunatus panaciterrae]